MAAAAKEVTKVAMTDGREVEFAGKKRLDKTLLIDADRAGVRFDFVNGETRTYWVPSLLLLQFAAHGMSQKYGDETSDLTDVDDAVEAIDTLDQRIQAGNWSAPREGGSGMAGASILAKALVKVTGQTITVVRGYLGGLDNKTKLALRVEAEVAPVIAALEAEQAARRSARATAAGKADKPSVDAAGILASLRQAA
jgi:hypothetical protein